jgi:hypothetical protein
MFSNLLTRARERSRNDRPGIAALIKNADNRDDIRARSSADDFPLWRIKCRVRFPIITDKNYVYNPNLQMGLEEEAIFYLLQRAEAEHQLRSAFTRGSIRGWIYLEANMNNILLALLRMTPGVISSRQGVQRNLVEFSDWLKMLTMHDPRTVFQAGSWV